MAGFQHRRTSGSTQVYVSEFRYGTRAEQQKALGSVWSNTLLAVRVVKMSKVPELRMVKCNLTNCSSVPLCAFLSFLYICEKFGIGDVSDAFLLISYDEALLD